MNEISVVMCTYNGERFVGAQLETILSQTLSPVEIIVGDDGSTDATLDVVAAIAERSEIPIRVHRNRRQLGFADNFLDACTYAGGTHIAFSDQDDVWAPNKLEAALGALVATTASLCVHPVRQIDASGMLVGQGRRRPGRMRVVHPLESDPWSHFYGFTMLFDRTLLDKIPSAERGPDPYTMNANLSHDRWIYFLASTFGRTVVLGEYLADYRQHGAQAFGGAKGRTLTECISVKLAAGQDQARYLTGVARHRALLLESWEPAGGDRRWPAGAARWRAIESHMRSRAKLYEHTSSLERLTLFRTIVGNGGYRKFRYGGLGIKRLAEDATVSAVRILADVGSRVTGEHRLRS